jgi:hypothetical protein
MTAIPLTIRFAVLGWKPPLIRNRSSRCHGKHCSPSYGSPQNSRAIKKPLLSAEACEIVITLLHQANVSVIGAGERFWELLQDQIREAQVTGPLVTDAALAALALEHGATLCSVDRDFRRFRGLKLIDPTDQSERDQ